MTLLNNPQKFRPKEDRDWATLAHFGGIIGPLPAYLIHRYFGKYGKFTQRESKEVYDFTAPTFLGVIIFFSLSYISLPIVSEISKWITVLLWVFMAFWTIKGGLTAHKGKPFRYPYNLLRFWRILLGRQKR